MKLRVSVALLLTIATSAAWAESEFSFGLGLGAPYAGIGVNAGLGSGSDLKYVALGCSGFYQESDEWHSRTCTGAIGWLSTGWLPQTADKHAIGPYLGPIDAERKRNGDVVPVYGVGVTYAYFVRGIARRGFHFGATPAIGHGHYGTESGLLIHLGYQF